MAKKRKRKANVTALTAQARQQLLQADLLSIEQERSRISAATKGLLGLRSIRASGSTSGYFIGAGPAFRKPLNVTRRKRK